MFVNIKVMKPLFCQPVFLVLEFYASNYSSVSTFEYQSNLRTMPTSFGVADITDKHCYALSFIKNNPHDRLIR